MTQALKGSLKLQPRDQTMGTTVGKLLALKGNGVAEMGVGVVTGGALASEDTQKGRQ